MTNTTFHRVTNEDIYREVVGLDKKLNQIQKKAEVNTWIATTALTLALIAITGIYVVG